MQATPESRSRLAAIQDEVRELHPLLARLLPKVPTVRSVEYTHGNTELGADFILQCNHGAFGTPQYVGVVAKIGKIVQDTATLERQIDECFTLQHNVAGTKLKTRLNEVWVVATGSITKNAKEKLHEKFQSRAVIFKDGTELASLIDNYVSDYWTNIALEVGEYLSNVYARAIETERAVSLLRTEAINTYIDQDLMRIREDQYLQKKKMPSKRDKSINLHVFLKEIENESFLLVEGGMGAGKSRLIRRLVTHYATAEVFMKSNILPISVTYKEFIDSYSGDINTLIEANLGPSIPHKQREESTILLLIDSIDEKDLPLDEQLSAVRSLAVIPDPKADKAEAELGRC